MPPDPSKYIQVHDVDHSAIVTLIAGYPATDNQFNYDGYSNGSLVLTVPVTWHVTIQCENRGTVPNSCAIVAGRSDKEPIDPLLSTPDPDIGLPPGQSASFTYVPLHPGSFRVASLVGGSEASGMWLDLEIVDSGRPTLAAPGS